MKQRYIKNAASNRAINPEFESILASWHRFFHPGTPFGLDWSQIFFWFSSSQSGGKTHDFPGDEPGARLILSRAESSPCSARQWNSCGLILLSPSLQRNSCLARENLPWACTITKGFLWAEEERGAGNREGARRSLGEWAVPGAESWDLPGHPLRVTGVTLEGASSWVCSSMASVLLELLGKEWIPRNWTFHTTLLCFYLKNFSLVFHR